MSARRFVWLTHALAALAFTVYAAAVLVLDQAHTNKFWSVEADNGFPSAISFTVYGAPLGILVDKVDDIFHEIYRPGSSVTVQDAFARTAAGQVKDGQLRERSDGTGPGYPLFSSLAMWFLGPRLSSVVYAFLALMGLSSLMYGLRFQDDRLLLVPLQYLALTTMILTPMVTNDGWSPSTAIAGERYFMLAGILPAFHLLFEVSDSANGSATAWIKRALLIILQTGILVLVIFVRNSIAYLLAPIFVAAGFLWWRGRRQRQIRFTIYWKAPAIAITAMIVFIAVMGSMPSYLKSGREFGIVWHRAFISLGAHPEFPFGDMAERIDCRKFYPEGLQNGILDRNAHCLWTVAPKPLNGRLEVFGPEYEKVMRAEVIRTIITYPRQALELYFYYKPLIIARTLVQSLDLGVTAANARAALLVGAQWLVFLSFATLAAATGRRAATPRIALVLGTGFLLSLTPGIVAWSGLATGADTIFFMYCLLGFAAAGIADYVCRMAASRPLAMQGIVLRKP